MRRKSRDNKGGKRRKLTISSFTMRTLREWALAVADMTAVAIIFAVTAVFAQIYVLDHFGKEYLLKIFTATPVVIGCFFLFFFIFRVFKVVWRFARVKDYLRVIDACILGTLLFILFDQTIFHLLSPIQFQLGESIPVRAYNVYVIMPFTTSAVICMAHIAYAFLSNRWTKNVKPKDKKRTLIIGAGSTGSTVVEELSRRNSIYEPICFVDDDLEKRGRIINGVPIVGSTQEIPRLAAKYSVSIIIFAIPSMPSGARKTIIENCMKTGCQVRVLPYVSELIGSADMGSQIREGNIGDLLGRQQITFGAQGVSAYVKGKVCMITGGGGSIGSELVRQIVKYGPSKVVIVDIYENTAYEIQQEILRNYGADYPICVEIASITDRDKLDELFEEHKPRIVFHAAAHKHVPLMETNPEEACKNNIFGTLNTVQMADKHGVQKFVMISTDKAVNPTNVMGATKRCCEMIVQMMAQSGSKTEFAAVRFGNVLGSNGSVIPLFKEQIKKGGPVTVTHPDIIRYFMTIPEAVNLVLQAGTFAKGGEIFVLNMGEPVKILTLAEGLITMMGYRPYTDIEIKFTGLRPGEKLFEELLMEEEGLRATDNEKIFVGKQIDIDRAELLSELEKMRAICATNDKDAVLRQLKHMVPTFNHDTSYLRSVGAGKQVITTPEPSVIGKSESGEPSVVVSSENKVADDRGKSVDNAQLEADGQVETAVQAKESGDEASE